MIKTNRKILSRTRPAENQYVDIIPKVKERLVDNCDKRHRIIVGGRGKGASWSIARIFLVEGMLESLFLVCVREVQKTIAHSVKKLLEDQIKLFHWEWFYKVQETKIVGINGTKFIFNGLRDFNADNLKSLEGADRCWVAEAQTISRKSINILRPTIRKEDSVVYWDFNPRYETDPVYIDYIVNRDPHSAVLWLSYKDNPWFTPALQKEMESDYSRDQEEADHIWLGKLRTYGEKIVCSVNMGRAAMERQINYVPPGSPIVVGADIAHQGGDEITFYKRVGFKVIDTYFAKYQDTVKTVKELKSFMGDRSVILNIDNGYIGAAVADYMEDDKYTVNRINFGGTPIDTDHYADTVTEMYFNMRDKLDIADIPYDEELLKQLCYRRYNYINGHRGYEVMKIESKDEFSEHSIADSKSPDRADGLVLCYYDPEENSRGMGTLTSHNYME